MKKFGIYCIIIVVALFLGFTTYYFVANKEQIVCAYDQNSTIKLNIGETIALSDVISHKQAHPNTVLNVEVSNPAVISYNTTNKIFTASAVGLSTVTITPSNTKFGPFVINFKVGNGSSQDYPIYISNQAELVQIGTGDYTTNKCYELIADIRLTNNWTPIPTFTGVFEGANFTIYDMHIIDGHTNAGFIGQLGADGIVKNVKFNSASLNGTTFDYAGVVVGLNNGTVCGCEVIDSALNNSASNGKSGIIVGGNEFTDINSTSGKSARIGMCGVENTSINATNYMGGIAGTNVSSIIENSYSYLSLVEGNNAKFGGITGLNQSYSNASYNKVSTIKHTHANAPCVTLTNSIIAGIVGQNIDNSTTVFNTLVRNYFTIDTPNFVGEITSADAVNIEKKLVADMKNQSTYVAWDFSNVWTMGELYAVLNYNKPFSTTIGENEVINPTDPEEPNNPDDPPYDPDDPDEPNDPDTPIYPPSNPGGGGGAGGGAGGGGNVGTGGTIGNIIPPSTQISSGTDITSANIYAMICEMRNNPNTSKVYVVKDNINVDMNSGEWTTNAWVPIGTNEKPFNCQFIVESGKSLTFNNFNAEDTGFFGVLGSGAKISGIKFTNAQVGSSSNSSVGVVAGTVKTGAIIQHITILNSTITANGNAGIVSGTNYGEIKYISASNCTINSAQQLCKSGGISGHNKGTLYACYSLKLTIKDLNTNTASYGFFGGISGANEGIIKNCATNELNAKLVNKGSSLFLGGISGHNSNSITKSAVVNSVLNLSTDNVYSKVGGLVSVNTNSISFSHTLDTKVLGYYAGGLTASNGGELKICSVGSTTQKGSVSGMYSGGLTSVNEISANIKNCLVATEMLALDKSGSKTCGFAYKLEKDSIIANCFSMAEFSGNGECFADTDTPYSNPFTKNVWQYMPFGYLMGDIQNCAVYNVSNKPYVFNLFGVDYINVSLDNAKGQDNFETFFNKDFSQNYWNFVVGQFPNLK